MQMRKIRGRYGTHWKRPNFIIKPSNPRMHQTVIRWHYFKIPPLNHGGWKSDINFFQFTLNDSHNNHSFANNHIECIKKAAKSEPKPKPKKKTYTPQSVNNSKEIACHEIP